MEYEHPDEDRTNRKRKREVVVGFTRLGKRAKHRTSIQITPESSAHVSRSHLLESNMKFLRSTAHRNSRKALECLQFIDECIEYAIQDEAMTQFCVACCYDLGFLLREHLLWGTSQHQIEALWILSSTLVLVASFNGLPFIPKSLVRYDSRPEFNL
jgi:hypothetical protein